MLKAGLVTAIAGLALLPAAAGATTYNVNTTADGFLGDGKCGLREAVEAANDNDKQSGCPKGQGKRDVIVLKGTTYNLTVPSTNESDNVNGDLDVQLGGPITVRGAGRTATTIHNSTLDRVFDLENLASSLRLEKLKIDNGDVTSYGGFDGFGGNIRSNGRLTVDRSTVDVGDADQAGSIYSGGTLTVTKSDFSGNDAQAAGGTLFISGNGTISRTVIDSSEVAAPGNSDAAGGAVYSSGDQVTIVDSAIRGSSADATAAFDGYGGAIFALDGNLDLIRSEISGNGVSAANNGREEFGAAVYLNNAASADIVNSTLYSNQAGSPDGVAGAVYNAGTLTMQHATLDSNTAPAFADQIYTAGNSSIGRSIVTGDNGTDPCAGATATTLGFNIAEFNDPACGWGGTDDTSAFIGFANNLQANGGPTQTVALSPGSDAVDFVPKGECKTITKSRDQRGFARPNRIKVGKNKVPQPCDAGSYELGAKAP